MIEEIRKTLNGCIVKLDGKGGEESCVKCKFIHSSKCVEDRLFDLLNLDTKKIIDVIIS